MSHMRQTKKSINLNDDLIDAILKDDIARVESLCKKGADPNGYIDADKLTPLFFAVSNNALQSAFYLIAKGADPNFYCEGPEITPLELAKFYNHKEMVLLLQTQDDKQKNICH